MKITIWIHKLEAISGNITNYSFTRPYHDRNEEWVEVQITQNEFTQLEDAKHSKSWVGSDEWHVEQYNRNRDEKDWIKTKDEIPYIYERNGEEVYRRREGDSERELLTDAEFHASKKPIKKDLKKLLQELQTIKGAKFAEWWKGLTKNEQIQLTKFWE
ncbi:MAG: hypothetical protein P8P29_04265 [Flavobacteriaceae bacterium]|nr:hypothetical protein [Flavobacteriaceae bacterium]